MKLRESIIFAMRATAVISLAGAALEGMDGDWLTAIIFFAFFIATSALVGLIAMGPDEDP